MSTLNHNNLNNRPVGFFDSGVGGLSVYARFKHLLPVENTLYYGDLAHMPYGDKTKEELVSYARTILDFYKLKGVKAVVIACNTSSAQAYDIIKEEYGFKIYPIIQSCAKVIACMKVNRIGVFATQATVNSGAYKKELMKYNSVLEVCELACPDWVPIVESGNYDNPESIAAVEMHVEEMLKFAPDKIILGCTHYPYLMSLLTKFAPKELFIDPAKIFVEYIKNDFESLGLLNNSQTAGYEKMFVSANPESFTEHSKIFYELHKTPELA